jgi:hypothetical protein
MMLRHPHHAPPELVERAVARAVMPRALLVVSAIDLDDARRAGRQLPRRRANAGPVKPVAVERLGIGPSTVQRRLVPVTGQPTS